MKGLIVFCFALLFNIGILTSQTDVHIIETGIVFSDIKSGENDSRFEEVNNVKRGWQLGYTLRKPILNWASINIGFQYSERKALEFFSFPFGEDNAQGFSTMWVLVVPSSPQSENFDLEGYNFIHFPNFKYLHLNLVPQVHFGKKLKFNLGAGLFAGYLLNKNKLVFGREYFPWAEAFFNPPFNVYGEVRYQPFDWGVVGEISVDYPLSELINIGIESSHMQSLIRLNGTFVNKNDLYLNTRWVVSTCGLYVKYKLEGKKK